MWVPKNSDRAAAEKFSFVLAIENESQRMETGTGSGNRFEKWPAVGGTATDKVGVVVIWERESVLRGWLKG